MTDKFNVASAASIPGPILQLYEGFEAAGFEDRHLPDECGWMLSEPFSGQIVGRVAIRDTLGNTVAAKIGRTTPYSRAQKCNLMKEGQVLANCNWPVQSIPAIYNNSLHAIAETLVETKVRRRS
jgi:hypothetical protein